MKQPLRRPGIRRRPDIFTGVVVAALASATGHLGVYRGLFGVPLPDPHDLGEERLLPFVCASIVVVIPTAIACRLGDTVRTRALTVAAASATITFYFLLGEWILAGWDGLVLHDVWFGDSLYWTITAWRFALIAGVVALATGFLHLPPARKFFVGTALWSGSVRSASRAGPVE